MQTDRPTTVRSRRHIQDVPQAEGHGYDPHRKHDDALNRNRHMKHKPSKNENRQRNQHSYAGRNHTRHVRAKIRMSIHNNPPTTGNREATESPSEKTKDTSPRHRPAPSQTREQRQASPPAA